MLAVVYKQEHDAFLAYSKQAEFKLKSTPGKNLKLGDWLIVQNDNQYNIINQYYETFVNDGLVRVSIDCLVDPFQNPISHHFFGDIFNPSPENRPGTFRLQIRKGVHGWIVDGKQPAIPKPVDEITVLGIVAGEGKSGHPRFVWCRETRPGHDVIIAVDERAPIGTWILMKFSAPEAEYYFRSCPPGTRIWRNEYMVVRPVHSTQRVGNTIQMTLDLFVDKTERPGELWHPFVRLIRNPNKILFSHPGKYSITIKRKYAMPSMDGQTKSVWELVASRIVQVDMLAELPPLQNLTIHAGPAVPAVPQAPAPAKALINRIITRGPDTKEEIYIWALYPQCKPGKLFLDVPAEKLDLREGSVFTGTFTIGPNGTLMFRNPERGVKYTFETRHESGALQVRICSEHYIGLPNNKHKYAYIIHEDFGDVFDNRNLLATHRNAYFNVWIINVKVDDVIRWVVAEVIVTY